MSVEPLVVSAIVTEGLDAVKKMLRSGVTKDDFASYDDEVEWILDRAQSKKPFSSRLFKQRFPDFPILVPEENLADLFEELKRERTLMDLKVLLDSVYEELDIDRAPEVANFMRDRLSEITRLHTPVSDYSLIGDWVPHLKDIQRLRALSRTGASPGLSTGFKWIDYHWDGLLPGRFVVTLGRPGEGKSYLTAKFAWEAVRAGETVLYFSPEMNQFEHRCRIHTLASADKRIQSECGLKTSFRNRALMNGIGFNLKQYRRFLQHLADNYGEIHMPTGVHRRQRMSVPYIEAKIEDHAPSLVIVDPLYKLQAVKGRATRTEELAEIADSLQDLAETYNVPIVTTNQAHRQGVSKGDAPHKDSGFNSDVPTQEADHVIGVKNISDERRLLLRCSKSRFGQDFRFECVFNPNTGFIQEVDEPSDQTYDDDSDPDEAELRKVLAASRGEEDDE